MTTIFDDTRSCENENRHLMSGASKTSWSRFVSLIWSRTRLLYFLIGFSSLLGGFLFGYDLGIISTALLQLTHLFQLSCFQREFVVSSLLIGALFGAIVGGPLLDYIGRRCVLVLNGFVFVLGTFVATFSQDIPSLIVGRLILGMCVSISAIGECLYVSEIVPQRHRGKMVSLNELGITIGLLGAYFIGYLFTDHPNGWRIMFGAAGFPAFLMTFILIFLPPSPRFLVLKGKFIKAEEVLRLIRTGSDCRNEMNNIRINVENEKNRKFTDIFSKAGNFHIRILIGAGLVLFQQFSGQPNILYYAPIVFRGMGFTSYAATTQATVLLGIVKVVCTVLAICLVDRIGRRKLMIGGPLVMCLSMFVIAITCLFWVPDLTGKICTEISTLNNSLPDNISLETSSNISMTSSFSLSSSSPPIASNLFTTPFPFSSNLSTITPPPAPKLMSEETARVLTMISLFVFVAAYGFSFGPVTWLLLSEIFPSSLRGRAMSLAIMLNWASNLIISLTFLDILNSVGQVGTFFLYCTICLLAVIFSIMMVPETKGKTLEKISREFEKGLIMPNQCCRCLFSNSRSFTTSFEEALQESTVWTSVVS